MSVDTIIAIEGLSAYESLQEIPEKILLAASRAINKTTERARVAGRREIQKQVNLPARYISDNLFTGQAATTQRLEREIVGRFRPTSLARYARGTPESTRRAGGVNLNVAPGGGARWMGRAFLVRLRGIGGESTGPNANIGLAIRLRPGETIRNKKVTVSVTKSGLTLLYGPSVDQLFQTVREDIAPDTSDFLEREFLRLVEVDLPK